MIQHILDRVSGKLPAGSKRSGKWPAVRKAFLAKNPTCAACGGTEDLEVHHVEPFHDHPEEELEEPNFIVLCESGHKGVNCHLFFGHLGNFKNSNPNVRADAAAWLVKLGKAA